MQCSGGYSYCNDKNMKLVIMKSASVPKAVFKGKIVLLCSECRKFENGQFKFLPSNPERQKIAIRISWQYTHHLNSRSRVERVKEGFFIKMKDLNTAVVHFDDNKTRSRIPIKEMRFI